MGDANGKRFANELGRRDYVTGEMWKNKPPFRLCLNKAASEEIHWHCKHYTGRGVMKFYESGEALAKDMGVPLTTIEATHDAHYQAAKKTEKDPDGGSWPAYPSGKSWDEANGKTGSGKKFYHNIIPGSAVKTEPFYVAIITPVIHYCMGGLEIDTDSAVVDATGKAIPGLYAAGEVEGGVHGNNRLGGNSLLDCVVFGRVAGKACAKYMLGDDMKDTSLAELSGGGLSGDVEGSKHAGGSYEDNMNKNTIEVPRGPDKKVSKIKTGFSMDDVGKHTTKTDCWVVLHNRVLNVTSFLSQHPGGELAILTFAGKDATAEFDMIHPPDVVGKYAPDAIIGAVGAAKPKKAKKGGKAAGGGGGGAAKDKGSKIANHQAWGTMEGAENWLVHLMDEPIGFLGFAWAYAYAGWSLLLSVLYEVCATIFSATNIKITNDRVGLTRSAIFLIIFIIIHAVGNLHVFKGPDDFNGYGYFYVRLYWTGFGLPANIVEEYVLLSIMLHVGVGLKRTWDQKLALVKNQGLSVLNLAMTGLMLMTFMTIHLFQFRFGDTDQFGPYYIRPPPFMINFEGILTLDLFWSEHGEKVGVRDIYALEFQIFKNPVWSFFYTFSVLIFMTHACLGWKKVTPVLVPKRHVSKSEHIGFAIIIVIGLVYLSFPLYVVLANRFAGYETSLQVPLNRDA